MKPALSSAEVRSFAYVFVMVLQISDKRHFLDFSPRKYVPMHVKSTGTDEILGEFQRAFSIPPVFGAAVSPCAL